MSTSGPIVRAAMGGPSPHAWKWDRFAALYHKAKTVGKMKGLRPIFDKYDILTLCKRAPGTSTGDIIRWAMACLVQLCRMGSAGVYVEDGDDQAFRFMYLEDSGWLEEALEMKWDEVGRPKELGGRGKLALKWKVVPALRGAPFVSGFIPASTAGTIKSWWEKERYLVPLLFAQRAVVHGGPPRGRPHLLPADDSPFLSITSALGGEPLAHSGKICGCGACDLTSTVVSVVHMMQHNMRPAEYIAIRQYQTTAQAFFAMPKPSFRLCLERLARGANQRERRQVHNDLKNHFLPEVRDPATWFPRVDGYIHDAVSQMIEDAFDGLGLSEHAAADSDSDEPDTHGQEMDDESSDEDSSSDGSNGGSTPPPSAHDDEDNLDNRDNSQGSGDLDNRGGARVGANVGANGGANGSSRGGSRGGAGSLGGGRERVGAQGRQRDSDSTATGDGSTITAASDAMDLDDLSGISTSSTIQQLGSSVRSASSRASTSTIRRKGPSSTSSVAGTAVLSKSAPSLASVSDTTASGMSGPSTSTTLGREAAASSSSSNSTSATVLRPLHGPAMSPYRNLGRRGRQRH